MCTHKRNEYVILCQYYAGGCLLRKMLEYGEYIDKRKCVGKVDENIGRCECYRKSLVS